MKYAVVTGVSSGIGKATARKFLEEGLYVFGSVRKEQDAADLEVDYPKTFHKLIFDTTDYPAVDKAVEEITNKVGNKGLSVLVNNAGVAKYGPIQHVPIEEMRQQYEVNVFAPMYLTQKLLWLLGASKEAKWQGKVIVISSTAGVMTRPMLGPYSSSKHAVEAVFDALRRELMIYGLDVVIIEPGPIKTEIWDKAKGLENPYEDTDYKEIFDQLNEAVAQIEEIGLDVTEVSNKIWKAYTAKSPKTRYVVAPQKLKFKAAMYWLPDKTLDKIFYKDLKKLTK